VDVGRLWYDLVIRGRHRSAPAPAGTTIRQ